MARDFYPFVEKGQQGAGADSATPGAPAAATDGQKHLVCEVNHPARIAVYDDASAAPRVVVVEPKDVRDYLEEITATVNRLSHEQGGTIPFMVIREIVENFIHAYFQAPTITILDGGNTIRFSDQGPGIKEKRLALEYGTSSATEEMKHYIRGVGSGLPYAQQYMEDKGGSLDIEDNIAGGTVVTISTRPKHDARAVSHSDAPGEKDQLVGAGTMPGAGMAPVAAAFGTAAAPSPVPGAPMSWPAGVAGMPQGVTYPQADGSVMPAQPWGATPAQQQPWPGYASWPGQVVQPAQQSWPTPAPAAPQPTATAPAPQPAVAPAPAGTSFSPAIQLDERSQQVMAYLAEHEQVGPTDLVQTYGSSSATWSRVLSNLAAQGLLIKGAQKYQLTGIGRNFV